MNEISDETEKKKIEETIKEEFYKLDESEKEEVRRIFLSSLDETLENTGRALDIIDLKIEMLNLSKYLKFPNIAKDYFGKSKQWLYQRIQGYKINGKTAEFSASDKEKLKKALIDISEEIKKTALRIS